jgi:hypothetical protein
MFFFKKQKSLTRQKGAHAPGTHARRWRRASRCRDSRISGAPRQPLNVPADDPACFACSALEEGFKLSELWRKWISSACSGRSRATLRFSGPVLHYCCPPRQQKFTHPHANAPRQTRQAKCETLERVPGCSHAFDCTSTRSAKRRVALLASPRRTLSTASLTWRAARRHTRTLSHTETPVPKTSSAPP